MVRLWKMKKYSALLGLTATIIAVFLVACGSSSDSNSKGRISLGLTDATTNEHKADYVTIDEVKVHLGEVEGDDNSNGDAGWRTVVTP
jgi:hypothetical protein